VQQTPLFQLGQLIDEVCSGVIGFVHCERKQQTLHEEENGRTREKLKMLTSTKYNS
jgi:hypothetical protein